MGIIYNYTCSGLSPSVLLHVKWAAIQLAHKEQDLQGARDEDTAPERDVTNVGFGCEFLYC